MKYAMIVCVIMACVLGFCGMICFITGRVQLGTGFWVLFIVFILLRREASDLSK